MKAEELRIGNIIQDFAGNFFEFKLQDFYNIENYKILEYCKPIIITEEILLNFGFKLITLKTKKYMIKDLCNEPCFFLNKDNSIRYQNTFIKHVHQLQNLYFALTSQELQYETR